MTARAALLLLTGLLLWSVVPAAGGWSSTVVMSNSMAPRLFAGDVVLIRPVTSDQLAIGQILLVDDPDHAGRLRLHRLTAMDESTGELTLKGDANTRADSATVRTNAVHGVAALRVPWVGSPLVWLQEGRIRLLAGAVAALTALAAGVWCYRPLPGPDVRRRPRMTTTRDRATAAAASDPVANGWLLRDGTVVADRSDTRRLYRASDLDAPTGGQAVGAGADRVSS